MRDNEFNAGVVLGVLAAALIVRTFWVHEIEGNKRTETAWRIYQESRIDESARLAKEKIQ